MYFLKKKDPLETEGTCITENEWEEFNLMFKVKLQPYFDILKPLPQNSIRIDYGNLINCITEDIYDFARTSCHINTRQTAQNVRSTTKPTFKRRPCFEVKLLKEQTRFARQKMRHSPTKENKRNFFRHLTAIQ